MDLVAPGLRGTGLTMNNKDLIWRFYGYKETINRAAQAENLKTQLDEAKLVLQAFDTFIRLYNAKQTPHAQIALKQAITTYNTWANNQYPDGRP